MRQELSSDGYTVMHYHGPWNQLMKMSHVLCEDGVERTVTVGEPDTFFTVPGRTKAKGRTVTGYVTTRTMPDGNERHVFIAMGKNAYVLRPNRICLHCWQPAEYTNPDGTVDYCAVHKNWDSVEIPQP